MRAPRFDVWAVVAISAFLGCSAPPPAVVPDPPAAPRGVAAVAGAGQVRLSWDAVAGATSYDLYWATSPGVLPATGTKIAGVPRPVFHVGIANGTTYYYVVTATGLGGESAPSAEVSATPRAVPPAPTGLTATRGDAEVTLTWSTVATADSYVLHWSAEPSAPVANRGRLEHVMPGYRHLGLTNGATYVYAVTAVNAAGEGPASLDVTAKPEGRPATPIGVATRGDRQVSLAWEPVDGANAYYVYTSTLAGVTKLTGTKRGPVTSPFVHTGLTNGVTQYYVLTAENFAGESEASGQLAAVPLVAPAAPAEVVATRGRGQVTVTWTAPELADHSNLYWSASPGVTRASGTRIAGVFSPFTLTGLIDGEPVYLAVSAENDAGEGSLSDEATATPLALPSAPVATAARGDGRVTFSWSAVPTADAYHLYWSLTPGVTKANGTKLADVTSPYTLTGLTNGAPVYAVLTAVNAAGESEASGQVSATPLVAPAAPTGLLATSGPNRITLTWSPSAGADRYHLYWSTTAGVTPASGTKISGASSGYVHAGLTDGAAIFYVVTAENAAGESAASAPVSASPLVAPPAPTGLLATLGAQRVSLAWDAAAGADRYDLYWSTTSGVTKQNGTKIAAVASPFVHFGLTDGTPYYYVVTAENAAGEGPASTQATATPSSAPAAPTGLVAVPGDGHALLTWNPSPRATSYRVYTSRFPAVSTGGTRLTTTATSADVTGLENEGAKYFVVTAVNAQGESPASALACAYPTGREATGLTLYDGLCGTTLSGQKWLNPEFGRFIHDGVAELATIATDMQSRLVQGLSYQHGLTVNNAAFGRVTSLQADVTVPATTASTAGAGSLLATVRLNYQPAVNRGLSFPGQNRNLLIATMELVDSGTAGLQVRRQIFHCDDAACATLSATGITTVDPPQFVPNPASPTVALAPAAYDTRYTLRVAFDEATNRFTWGVSGGIYASEVTGTADVSAWLATPGLGMVMNTTNTGFAAAQLFSRALDNSAAGGGSASVFARFDDVRVGFNGNAPALWDDFETMGSNADTGFSVAKWGGAEGGVFLENAGLTLETGHTAVGIGGGATNVGPTLMFPSTVNTWAADLAVTEDRPPPTSGSFDNVSMSGAYYNDGTAGGAVDNAIGDIRANMVLTSTNANFNIVRCTSANCAASVFLTSFPSNVLPASSNHPFSVASVHRLFQKWDPATHTFTFRLDDAAPVVVDPTSATDARMTGGTAPVGRALPFVPIKGINARVSVAPGSPAGTRGFIRTRVNNVFVAP